MNHQYIKELLFTEEPLTLEQDQILEDHIKGCQSCQQLQTAWSDLHQLFKASPVVDPLPGFVSRWEKHMSQQRRHTQKRLTWIIFAGLAGIAFLILILLGLQVFDLIRSPQQIALVFLSRLAVLISYLAITKDYLSFLSAYIPKVSIPLIVFASGILTLLCVVWLATMKQISSAWRVVK